MEIVVLLIIGTLMLGVLALVVWLVVAVVRASRVSRRLRERVGDLEAEIRKQTRNRGSP